MDMSRLSAMAGMGGGPQQPAVEGGIIDSSETVLISSLALLKVCSLSGSLSLRRHSSQMLKHGRAGVPLEVMGLMLGELHLSLDRRPES